jgi:5-hydroxyisourate hydrolase-like protein (transthyretin family)
LIPLKQFTGNDPKWFWNSAYSPNCGSMGIGKLYSRVLDTKGKPVAGVVIRLWWPDARPDEYMDSTPTGNDGSFEIAFAGPPRDFTAYVAVHAHWGNPVESSEVLTIQFQAARGKDCLTVADGGTGLGHQWAIIVFTKHW